MMGGFKVVIMADDENGSRSPGVGAVMMYI